jgi:L-threonylcarbamoyladenylate synthase
MLARHYAPRTPLILLDASAPAPVEVPRSGYLRFQAALERAAPQEILSPRGDLPEAATRLFACLRRLDALGLERIYAWKVPDTGLGLAINDRLTRAAF